MGRLAEVCRAVSAAEAVTVGETEAEAVAGAAAETVVEAEAETVAEAVPETVAEAVAETEAETVAASRCGFRLPYRVLRAPSWALACVVVALGCAEPRAPRAVTATAPRAVTATAPRAVVAPPREPDPDAWVVRPVPAVTHELWRDERALLGGLRAERDGSEWRVADCIASSALLDFRETPSGFLFLAEDGALYRASTFTGPLTWVDELPGEGFLVALNPGTRLLGLSRTGLYEATDAGLSAVDTGGRAIDAAFVSDTFGAVIVAPGRWRWTRDGVHFEDVGGVTDAVFRVEVVDSAIEASADPNRFALHEDGAVQRAAAPREHPAPHVRASPFSIHPLLGLVSLPNAAGEWLFEEDDALVTRPSRRQLVGPLPDYTAGVFPAGDDFVADAFEAVLLDGDSQRRLPLSLRNGWADTLSDDVVGMGSCSPGAPSTDSSVCWWDPSEARTVVLQGNHARPFGLAARRLFVLTTDDAGLTRIEQRDRDDQTLAAFDTGVPRSELAWARLSADGAMATLLGDDWHVLESFAMNDGAQRSVRMPDAVVGFAFADARHGVARLVGGDALVTDDGANTWTPAPYAAQRGMLDDTDCSPKACRFQRVVFAPAAAPIGAPLTVVSPRSALSPRPWSRFRDRRDLGIDAPTLLCTPRDCTAPVPDRLELPDTFDWGRGGRLAGHWFRRGRPTAHASYRFPRTRSTCREVNVAVRVSAGFAFVYRTCFGDNETHDLYVLTERGHIAPLPVPAAVADWFDWLPASFLDRPSGGLALLHARPSESDRGMVPAAVSELGPNGALRAQRTMAFFAEDVLVLAEDDGGVGVAQLRAANGEGVTVTLYPVDGSPPRSASYPRARPRRWCTAARAAGAITLVDPPSSAVWRRSFSVSWSDAVTVYDVGAEGACLRSVEIDGERVFGPGVEPLRGSGVECHFAPVDHR